MAAITDAMNGNHNYHDQAKLSIQVKPTKANPLRIISQGLES